MKRAPLGSPWATRMHSLIGERDVLRRLASCSAAIGLRDFHVESDGSALLLEDFGAVSLERAELAGKLAPREWLDLARRLTRLFVELHGEGVVHNDVSSSNVVIDSTRRTVKLIDFASALTVGDSFPQVSPRQFRGPMAYLSPEQTGRLQRTVDPRSDLYSLGVVLFELLTGRLPFPYSEPREVIHAHLAREPPRASDLVAGLPSAFSSILAKLLSKEPERRHQSAAELELELEHAASTGASTVPGVRRSSRPGGGIRLTRRSYGQRAAIEQLLAAQESVHERARAVLLVGEPGSGKTTLVERFALDESRRGAFFAMGGSDTSSTGHPHVALSQIAASLAKQLLGEGEARLSSWKQGLVASLGGTRSVLLEFCPEMRHLLPEPDLRATSPGHAHAQLAQALITLFEHAAALKRPPLCIFADDVHALADDSLKLLTDVIAGCRRVPLLFLFTHRLDESSSDRGDAWLGRLRKAGLAIDVVEVPPLRVRAVAELIRDSLPDSNVDADALASIITARTRGNPFFVRTFLQSLATAGLLDDERKLDLERINELGVTANVAELLAQALARLSERTRHVLAVAACVGSVFEETLLQACVGDDAPFELEQATACGVVLPLASVDHAADGIFGGRRFRFAHELVRRTALSTLSAESEAELHDEIGRALLDREDPSNLGDAIFDIARHLNGARSRINSTRGGVELAELNLRAARAALARAGATKALDFARVGVEILGTTHWADHYELARDLHVVACEAAFENANHEVLAELAPRFFANVRTPVEASRIHWLQGRVLQARSKSTDAIRTFAGALSQLGITLELDPSPEEVAAERRLTREWLERYDSSELAKLPRSSSEVHTVAAEFLSKLVFFAYSDMAKSLPIVICRLVRLSLEHGLTAESANGFTFYGLLLALDGDRQGAVRYAKVALDVAHEFGDATNLSQTYLYASYLLLHWRLPLAAVVERLGDAYRHGLESGSPLNTACSATTLCICRFWAGHELARLSGDMVNYRKVIVRFRQLRILNWHEILLQAIDNLRNGAKNPSVLCGTYYDEAERYREHVELNDKTAIYNLNVARTLVAFLFRDLPTALEYSERNRRIPPLFNCSVWAVPVTFLDALCLLACCDDADELRRASLVAEARIVAGRLAEYLADNPREIEPKYCLVEAELLRVQGDADAARRHYEKAIALSGSSPLDAALSSEAAGRFEHRANERDAARRHLRAAEQAYRRWGATAKAQALEAEFPDVFRSPLVAELAEPISQYDFWDLASYLEASRALSGEVKLDGVLKKLMGLLVQTAGAQTGCLLMKRNGRWVIEAAQSAEGGTISVLEGLSPHEIRARGISPPAEEIVNFVVSTGRPVVLPDECTTNAIPPTLRASSGGQSSVLCFAVQRQGETLAIAYLENRLIRGAFSPNGLRILEMLSAQAAVSLENASLYAELESRVEARTRELSAKTDELEATLRHLTYMQRVLSTQEEVSGLATIAGGLAHEIKNPLNFISMFAGAAGKQAEKLVREVEAEIARFRPEKQRTLREVLDKLRFAVRKVVEHTDRANDIVNRMGPHATGEAQLKRVDLNEIVRSAMDSAALPSGLTISIIEDLAADPVVVTAVPQDIERVVVNLVTNATQAVKQKLEAFPTDYVPEIKLTTRALDDEVELRVFDNGIGVPEARQKDVFLAYFTTKSTEQGRGLGLFISRNIVDRGHGGSLSLSSIEGEFSEFVMRLPVVAQPRPDFLVTAEASPRDPRVQ